MTDSENMTSSEYVDSMISIEIPEIGYQISKYNDLAAKSGKVHASYIFHRENISTDKVPQICKNIFVNLVKRIGGTKDNLYMSGWKDFGYYLGLGTEEINYIENSIKSCPTEAVLRVFCQGKESTFERIVQSLLKMERLDVIEGIYDELDNLLSLLNKIENDQGYYSNGSRTDDEIIRPRNFENNLPEVLRSPDGDDAKYVKSAEETLDVSKPSVLLTYFDDGIEVANKIFDIVEDKKIKVLCLEKEKFKVLANPEQYIRFYVDKVNYIVPILTKGYLKTIESPIAVQSSTTDNVDCSYVRFIYTLMSFDYINGKGCLNTRVRCILPDDSEKTIINELFKYPLLSVWMRENEIDKLISLLFR